MLVEEVEVTVVADFEDLRHNSHADGIALAGVKVDNHTQRKPPRSVGSPGKTKVSQRRDRSAALRYARDTVTAIKHQVWIAIGLVALLGVALVAAATLGVFGPSTPSLTPAQIAAQRAMRATKRLLAEEASAVRTADALVAVKLPQHDSPPPVAPATPASLFRTRLAPVEVLGFVPYWEASNITASELADTSVLALYGVEVARSGRFLKSGPGWTYYADTGYVGLTTAAHSAGDRVLFTVSTTDPRVIGNLTRNPGPTGGRLAAAMAQAVQSGGFDGVDIDIEGSVPADRSGFVRFVAYLVASLRQDGMEKTIVLDCYPQSAGSSTNFFDVARLAPLVNQVFVMGYDMEQYANASANAPLASANLGLSDVQSILQYRRLVPESKLILGVPFYGIDFTTASGVPGSLSLTPAPSVETYSTIVAAGRTPLWDPGSQTVWTRFRVGSRWHETWFDNPVSVALKRALAAEFHLAGVGVWALGFEGNATAMLTALDGGSPPNRTVTASG